MRVVGGVWAGRDLVSPGARVRPTAEQIRDRWLSLLAGDLTGARILDLFAGSGALGLEALSRGAASADFVENGAVSLHALKANVAAFRVKNRTRIFKRDAIPFVEQIDRLAYDIALADPPYGSRKADRVVKHWIEVPFSRILCIEHDREQLLPRRGKKYDFGDTRITIYRARPGPQQAAPG